MRRKYRQLRSLLRGHERRIFEYTVGTLALFVLSLLVLRIYVGYYELDERAAKGATSITMFLLALPYMIAVWRKRRIALMSSVRRLSLQRVGMAVVPHGIYIALVGVLGLPYFYVVLGIAFLWGFCIALPLNYLLHDRWSLKGIKEA